MCMRKVRTKQRHGYLQKCFSIWVPVLEHNTAALFLLRIHLHGILQLEKENLYRTTNDRCRRCFAFGCQLQLLNVTNEVSRRGATVHESPMNEIWFVDDADDALLFLLSPSLSLALPRFLFKCINIVGYVFACFTYRAHQAPHITAHNKNTFIASYIMCQKGTYSWLLCN